MAGASFAAEAKDSTSIGLSSSIAPATSEELLGTLESSKSIDLDWMLQDNRQTLPTHLAMLDSTQAGASLRSGTLGTSRTELPKISAPPSTVSTGNVNDLLVPVPVLSLGWSIVLSAVLFQVGARVLKLHRRKAA
jgi:hypothetical protein